MTKPPPNALKLPLEQRAEMALRAAVERVIIEHARQRLPIYIWHAGKVVEIPAYELRAQAAVLGASS